MSAMGRPSTKVKRNACQGCYASRVKCEYKTEESDTCERCARQKRECIPRVVVRGRAAKVAKPSLAGRSHLVGHAGYPMYDATKNGGNAGSHFSMSRPSNSGQQHQHQSQQHQYNAQPMPESMPQPMPQPPRPHPQPAQPGSASQQQQQQQRGNGAAPSPNQTPPSSAVTSPARTPDQLLQLQPKEEAEPGSPESFASELDLNAYRSASLFDDLPHLGAHYAATASIVRVYRALGLSKPPPSIRWIVNLLYLLAITEKSMGLLHTSATLAVATGIELDVDQLNQRQTPLSSKQKTAVMDHVHSTFLVDDPSQAYFIIRLDAGDRGIVANQTYEFLFESAGEMVGRLSRSPHFRLWRDFVEDKTVCNTFTAEIVKGFLSAGEPVGNPAQINWTVQDTKSTRLKDKEGNSYSGVLFEYGSMSGGGFFTFLVFGFQQITPLDDGARRRFEELKAAGINRSAATPGPPPSLQRFNSLCFEMLPSGMDDVEVAPAPSDGSEISKPKKSWEDVLPRMDSQELLDALDLVVDSAGGRDVIEAGDWTH